MRERILLTIFVLTFPLVAYVSTIPPQRFRNEITEWGNRQTETYRDFVVYREKFGVNDFVIVSWPGCDLNDPRIQSVTDQISTELIGKVQQVSSGQQAYMDLRSSAGLTEAAALKRLQNSLVAKSSFDTAIGFNITDAGRLDRGSVILQLHDILRKNGVDPSTAFYSGLGHNLYTLDKEGLISPFRMVPQIILLALFLTVLFVRNVKVALFINALGIFTGCLAFNVVYLADVDMNAIIWPLPTLTMLLTVSSSLHFLSYFRKAIESCEFSLKPTDQTPLYRRQVARRARQLALKPTLCCTFTTAIGLLSLLLSTSEPVRQFGWFGAISIVAANGLMLLLFPAFLTISGYADRCDKKSDVSKKPGRHGWRWLAHFTDNYSWAILICMVLGLLACATGVPNVKTGSNLTNFFPADHRVLDDAIKVEASTGPLNSIELLLHFENHNPDNDRLRLRGIRELCSRIISDSPVEACISAATFSPVFKKRLASIQRSVETTKLKRLKEELVEGGLLDIQQDSGGETWRVSCRYSTLANVDIPLLSQQLKSIVHATFFRDDQLVLKGEKLEATTTGEFVLFDYVDRQFFRELMITYATAFGAITLVVLVILGTARACLVTLLPNLFPAVVVLGMAGHLGYRLDVASLMTASVALGIAVDDTLHFLLWQRETNSDWEADSIESTMRYCGRAMLQTSAILGGSIILYAFCGFLPTVRFGILLSAMMFAALAGDLILLPALLMARNRYRHPESQPVDGETVSIET